jgi:hypothetical protein
MADNLTAGYEPTIPTRPPPPPGLVAARGTRPGRPGEASAGNDLWRHSTPIPLAVGLWAAALAIGIAAGAISDSPPAGQDTQRRPQTVLAGPDVPETTSAPTTQTPATTQPPTSVAPATTPPPPTDDADDADEQDDDTADARCDAAQAAAAQALAALDQAHETLIGRAEAEQAATDGETHAEDACPDDD